MQKLLAIFALSFCLSANPSNALDFLKGLYEIYQQMSDDEKGPVQEFAIYTPTVLAIALLAISADGAAQSLTTPEAADSSWNFFEIFEDFDVNTWVGKELADDI